MESLDTWMDRHGETNEAFAHRIGRSASTVSRLRGGLTNPPRALVRAVFEATAGAITPNRLFGFGDAEDAAE